MATSKVKSEPINLKAGDVYKSSRAEAYFQINTINRSISMLWCTCFSNVGILKREVEVTLIDFMRGIRSGTLYKVDPAKLVIFLLKRPAYADR